MTYTWNLKRDTDELTHETETGSQTENRLVVAQQREVGEGWTSSSELAGANCYGEKG